MTSQMISHQLWRFQLLTKNFNLIQMKEIRPRNCQPNKTRLWTMSELYGKRLVIEPAERLIFFTRECEIELDTVERRQDAKPIGSLRPRICSIVENNLGEFIRFAQINLPPRLLLVYSVELVSAGQLTTGST